MSWSKTVMGRDREQIKKKLRGEANEMQYTKCRPLVADALDKLVDCFLPDQGHGLLVETSGHIDSGSGTATIKITSIHPSNIVD